MKLVQILFLKPKNKDGIRRVSCIKHFDLRFCVVEKVLIAMVKL